jgi:hypothetical protein
MLAWLTSRWFLVLYCHIYLLFTSSINGNSWQWLWNFSDHQMHKTATRQCSIITTKSVLGYLSSGVKLPTYLHPVQTDKRVKLNLYLLHTLMMLGLSYYPTSILNGNKLSVVSHCRYFSVWTETFRNVPYVLWLIPTWNYTFYCWPSLSLIFCYLEKEPSTHNLPPPSWKREV